VATVWAVTLPIRPARNWHAQSPAYRPPLGSTNMAVQLPPCHHAALASLGVAFFALGAPMVEGTARDDHSSAPLRALLVKQQTRSH